MPNMVSSEILRNSQSRQLADRALRIHGRLARNLGTEILLGRISPGTILDNEIVAASEHHVSRTAYREALKILTAKGLVTSRPRAGTRVNQPNEWHLLDPDVLAWIFSAEPNRLLLESLFELRRTIEPAAAGFAAARRTKLQVDTLEYALAGMRLHTLGTKEGRDADHQFHTTLLEATCNPFLRSLASGVSAAVAWTTIFKQRDRPLSRDPVPDHLAVFEAVRSQDRVSASIAMSRLIDLAWIDVERGLGAGAGD